MKSLLREPGPMDEGFLGFLNCMPTSQWNRGEQMPALVRQSRTRVPAPAFSCVPWGKSLNLSESQGSLCINWKNETFFAGLLRP